MLPAGLGIGGLKTLMHPTLSLRALLAIVALGAFFPTVLFSEEAPKTAVPVAPASAEFNIGDLAPALKPQQWLQGEPVTAFAKDKTYLIECWATWCGPCVGSIPHINALHHKFKDKGLVVVGMDVWEEEVARPAAFLKKQGDGMAYRVAFDGKPDGDVANSWLKPAGIDGIPHTFIIQKNRLIWQGHPKDLTDAMVESMIAGKFDFMREEKDRLAKRGPLKIAQDYIKKKKFEEALAALKSAEEAAKANPETIQRIQYHRAIILVEKGDPEAARNLIALAKSAPTVMHIQYFAAKKLLNAPQLKDQRDPKFAKICIGCMLVDEPTNPEALLLDAQADHALGDKVAAKKTLAKLAAVTLKEEESYYASVIAKAKGALEAVNAGKPWPGAPSGR